ncbi:proline hydroxylase [Trinickia violacea]|uniref:Proline hydroxylase n=1 Tax=Trinickia violacea TaxID=2571746 RepID=A0A4P8IUW1_9BURK|nr:2OG-Fe(II) oxygenase [Trinickia violacea]QCP49659.1 proline hydroxylase [Trinickia violacea]
MNTPLPSTRSRLRTNGRLDAPSAFTLLSAASPNAIAQRVDSFDWSRIEDELGQYGCATLPALLTADECDALTALYPRDDIYRGRVVMERHGFGRGEYKYFAYPLPEPIAALRSTIYSHLAPVANRWNEAMRMATRYPATHEAFIRRCHAAGQQRPTPLILEYGAGDYNCLHQDLYGEHVFPLQVAILLSQPGRDFTGGEFVLTEQRPRMQSRVEVVPLARADAVIFAVNHRPVQGSRGVYRVALRHGVSRLRSGRRHTLGVIFHDAL